MIQKQESFKDNGNKEKIFSKQNKKSKNFVSCLGTFFCLAKYCLKKVKAIYIKVYTNDYYHNIKVK